tara:strand:+ start:922 stop:1182 length:261 start_codon:yes stop_codon:yes gene_type:complete
MTDSDSDPDWHPPTDSESESDTESDTDECCCCCDDDWYIDNGDPEDALQTGLLTFVVNRKNLHAEHVPMYIDLLRNLLNQAMLLYK